MGEKEKYLTPDGEESTLYEIRKSRNIFYSDSNKLLSKIIHQDEFSIRTLYIY